MPILTYNSDSFLMDGKPYTILSGAMHYFRIPKEYWHDRLLKLKECGFNTVETYTCWNLHEPKEGEFDFSGMLDIEAYVQTAADLGLNVILRPGPYICAEWEFGGLPAWLLRYENIALRCDDDHFVAMVRRYYTELFRRLTPHLSTKGGNIIMVQIENEYGSYGNDKTYLNKVADIYRDCGVDCLLFTSDGPTWHLFNGGSLPEHLCVANFGSRPDSAFAFLKEYRPNQPCMCGEFWCGWFDHWYEEHHIRDSREVIDVFTKMLGMGGSVNFYMFHGGTNFGFMNGANYFDEYQPTVTSYDYNAPLSEAGDITPLYMEIRALVEQHFGKLPPLTSRNTEKKAYGKVLLTEKATLFDTIDSISSPIRTAAPKFMEDIGQNYGFTLYSTTITGPLEDPVMKYDCVNDRAIVYVNGKRVGTLERTRRYDEIKLELEKGETVRLDILLENMGRINYGPQMRDKKGITGIRFWQQYHYGWDMWPLEMKDLSSVRYTPSDGGADTASFMRGKLVIEGEPHDTFIRTDGFHHGFITVNGFNLGRYYNDAGPQKTLYCPAPMLKEGENEIVVFETDCSENSVIEFVDSPCLG
ncbi:MAG: beta-galactosidase [Ruminococcaceae bacterium]|nr:beta-galactosidase [Oscillospiraceae bacterium]